MLLKERRSGAGGTGNQAGTKSGSSPAVLRLPGARSPELLPGEAAAHEMSGKKKLPKPAENETQTDNCWSSVAELAHQVRDADGASHLELIRGQTQTRGKVDRVASTLTRAEAATNSWERGNLRGSRWCSPAAAARTNKSQNRMLVFAFKSKRRGSNFPRRPRCVWSRGEAWSSPFVVLLLQLLSAFHPADLAVAQPWTRASP